METATARLGSISPMFIVRNLQESISFYRDALGFVVEFEGPPDDPYFAIVNRDDIQVFLKEITPEVGPVPNNERHPWARWDAYVYTREPDILAAEFTARPGYVDVQAENNDDGLRGFEVKDPNGYIIYFGRLR